MAINTRSKRASSVRCQKPWHPSGPIGLGALDQGDRQHSTWQYSGILAGGAIATATAPRRGRMGGLVNRRKKRKC
jgi:hypothetical protein